MYFCDTILRTRKSLLKEKNISAFADIILRNLTPAHRLTADSCQTDCQQQKETLTHTFVLKQNKINTLANNAGLVRKVEFKHKHTLSHFINVTHWEKCQLNGVNIVFFCFSFKTMNGGRHTHTLVVRWTAIDSIALFFWELRKEKY